MRNRAACTRNRNSIAALQYCLPILEQLYNVADNGSGATDSHRHCGLRALQPGFPAKIDIEQALLHLAQSPQEMHTVLAEPAVDHAAGSISAAKRSSWPETSSPMQRCKVSAMSLSPSAA